MNQARRNTVAILAADVAGYSALMHQDEDGTLAALRRLRTDLFEPCVNRNRGTIVKRMGDGWFVEFENVTDAAKAAIDVQEQLASDEEGLIELRMGVHVGDVVHEGEDIFGDGINIATRLQEIVAPGGIAMSAAAHELLPPTLASRFQDAGEQALRNISHAARVYALAGRGGAVDGLAARFGLQLTLPDKPSIAVLPFENHSGDPEQEHFADGMTEDIISGLSRFGSLFVSARSSSLSFKGARTDPKDVSAALGVRYVLQGRVRKAGQRIRVTARLLDATTGEHVWAEHYDRELVDIFDLQDEITGTIVAAIDIEVRGAEVQRVERRPPDSMHAWEHYHRGMVEIYRTTKAHIAQAHEHFRAALKVDPNFAPAAGALAMCYVVDVTNGYADDPKAAIADGLRFALHAVEQDPKDAYARMSLGRLYGMIGKNDLAVGELQRAIDLNPSLAFAYYNLGQIHSRLGEQEKAIEYLDIGMRLSPRDPVIWAYHMIKGVCLAALGRTDESLHWSRLAVQEGGRFFWPHLLLTYTLIRGKRPEEAVEAAREAQRLMPELTVRKVDEMLAHVADGGKEYLLKAIRSAGIPEE